MASAGDEHYLGAARLDGYRLGFSRRSIRWGAGVLDLVRSADDAVWGALYELPPAALDQLDAREGAGFAYRRIEVEVMLGEDRRRAVAYEVIEKESVDVPPSREYVATVLAGARKRGLPREYVAELERRLAGQNGDVPTRKLADGNEIPLLGLGVWQVESGEETESSVRWALELGYRHIDTAQAYGNEESVGRALAESGVPREEIFLATKFYPGHEDPEAEAEKSLERLRVDHVDLYLIHWPQGGPTWAWPGMERAHERGYTRSIGISNFDVEELAAVMGEADVPPVVNQIQFSPFKHRRGLLEACEEHDVVLEAYSPLGTGRNLGDRTVGEIAKRGGRTPAQVLLRWCVQRELPTIPKSTHRERIEENAQIFDFELSDEDMAALDALDETGGTDRALERKWW
jgi:diketogulonate reductase-like aldo/keto reductase